jgi:hypothetical protein
MTVHAAGIEALRGHARQRSENARRAVERAIRNLSRRQQPINVNAVARQAGVTRRTIYNHADLLDRIRAHGSPPVPASAHEGDDNPVTAALRRQLEIQKASYEATIARLEEQLRDRDEALAAVRVELQRTREVSE